MARRRDVPAVRKYVKVEAISMSVGPPSTAVHVEVERDALELETGTEVRGVVAEVPERERDGSVRWTQLRLLRTGAPRDSSVDHVALQYSGVHYGCCEACSLGVHVLLETAKGLLRVHGRGEAYSAHSAGDAPSSHCFRSSAVHGRERGAGALGPVRSGNG